MNPQIFKCGCSWWHKVSRDITFEKIGAKPRGHPKKAPENFLFIVNVFLFYFNVGCGVVNATKMRYSLKSKRKLQLLCKPLKVYHVAYDVHSFCYKMFVMYFIIVTKVLCNWSQGPLQRHPRRTRSGPGDWRMQRCTGITLRVYWTRETERLMH